MRLAVIGGILDDWMFISIYVFIRVGFRIGVSYVRTIFSSFVL